MNLDDTPAERLLNRLNDHIKQRELAITGGGVSTFEEYKYICGALRGLCIAKDELEEMMANWARASELD